MEEIKKYVETHKERFLEELFELIRIPSISAIAEAKDDMLKTAESIKASLLKAGADLAEVKETTGWPVVYGHKIIDESLPTVLVYGHYDVQPVEPLELWDSPPFEPEVRDGKIFARGADDDHRAHLDRTRRSRDRPCRCSRRSGVRRRPVLLVDS